jgi:lysophospholipase L1-like esterase
MLSVGTIGVVTVLATKKTLGSRRADRVLTNLTISLVAIVVFIVAAEYGVRFFFRDITTTSENPSYFNSRYQRSDAVSWNSWGFRERNFDLAKPEGVYRIAVIGDSLTYGQGIGTQERFTDLLEQRLNNKSGEYEVLNFGRSGAETVDHVNILRFPVLYAEPDFILLQWFTNDVEGHDKSARPRPITIVPYELRRQSALFFLLHRQLSSIQKDLGFVKAYDEYMLARFEDHDSASSLSAEESLQEFINVARELNVPMGIVIFGDSYYHGSSLDFLVDRVNERCEIEAITCVDTRDIFGPYEGSHDLWVNRLDPHPSPLANRLVADLLLEAFEERWSGRLP